MYVGNSWGNMALACSSARCVASGKIIAFAPACASSCVRRVLSHPSKACSPRGRVLLRAEQETETSSSSKSVQDDLPIWVRRERERELKAKSGKFELPWPLYLLLSGIIAIAAVGSIFEFAYKDAIFGVIQPDNVLWAPILGFFVLTGLPLAAFLFFSGVNAANEAAEQQDKVDGYID